MGNSNNANCQVTVHRHSIDMLHGSKIQSPHIMDEVSSQANVRNSTTSDAESERHQYGRANTRYYSTRELDKMMEDNNTKGFEYTISQTIKKTDLHMKKYKRLAKHEMIIMDSINRYRREHKKANIKINDKFARELNEICVVSLQRGAFNLHIHKKIRGSFKQVAVCSENSLFLQQADNSWTSPVNFSEAVMNKWTHISAIDLNLKMDSANVCNIFAMTDGSAYCVFLLMYKE